MRDIKGRLNAISVADIAQRGLDDGEAASVHSSIQQLVHDEGIDTAEKATSRAQPLKNPT